MLKPSFYNRYTEARDPSKTIVFNRFWGSVAVFDSDTAERISAGDYGGIPQEEIRDMQEAGFLVPSDRDEKAVAEERYLRSRANNSLLGITISTGEACNIACGYCYQNDDRDGSKLRPETIDGVIRYIERIVSEGHRPITQVALRWIGGEPLMQKREILEATPRVRSTCERLGVAFHAQMDTNGLLIDGDVIRELDALSITITNKADHNTMRVRKNGTGTYEAILKKIRRHAEDFNKHETVLAIRYNVNAFNAKYATDVYRMVKNIGIRYTDFDLYEVVNYDYNLLIPTLTRKQYKDLYLDIIKLKVEHGETVTEFPRPTFAPCSGYTPFNIKVMASGALAVCDAPQEEIGSLAELLEDPSRHSEMFNEIAEHNPFQHPRCGNCPNIGICGGEVFCKFNEHAEPQNPCDFLPFDMDEFLRYFAEQAPKTPNRFAFETTG